MVNCVYNCCPTALDTNAQSEDCIQVMRYIAAPNTCLTTKCEIDNDVDFRGGLVENCSLEVTRSTCMKT